MVHNFCLGSLPKYDTTLKPYRKVGVLFLFSRNEDIHATKLFFTYVHVAPYFSWPTFFLEYVQIYSLLLSEGVDRSSIFFLFFFSSKYSIISTEDSGFLSFFWSNCWPLILIHRSETTTGSSGHSCTFFHVFSSRQVELSPADERSYWWWRLLDTINILMWITNFSRNPFAPV